MKRFKELLKVFLAILISISVLSMDKILFAETFYEYNIEVRLRKDGTAEFTSFIDLEPTKGIEYYFPVENLGAGEIKNFKVYEVVKGEMKEYTFVENWNIKASREEKANKNGLIKTKNGYELAFGIGDYKRKEFILKYEVTNFVKILKDSDMFFWKFVNDKMTSPPKKVRISIEREGDISSKNAKIWAFGIDGLIHFKNDKIEFNSKKPLDRSNYVTVLTNFDKGLFEGGEKIDKYFEYYKDMAFKGSSYKKKKSILEVVKSLIIKIISFSIFTYFLFKIIIFFLIYRGGYKKGDLKGEYYRKIPEKQWWRLSKVLKSSNFNGGFYLYGQNYIINCFFLKWIQEGSIVPVMEEDSYSLEDDSLEIGYKYDFESELEERLYRIMESASDEDRILQKNEFSRYLKEKKNLNEFKEFMKLLETESDDYVKDNYLLEDRLIGFGKKYNSDGREFTRKLVGYYNYLKDFTILDEREITEIRLWKELLIYATLFGIADTVLKRLEELSPDSMMMVEENMDMDMNSLALTISYSNSFYNITISSYNKESGSGSGGISSSGGGGGSFGGGSGGGSR